MIDRTDNARIVQFEAVALILVTDGALDDVRLYRDLASARDALAAWAAARGIPVPREIYPSPERNVVVTEGLHGATIQVLQLSVSPPGSLGRME